MKMIKNILFFALILTIKSDETIDFSSTLSSGTGYSVSDNTVTISSEGTNTNKNIIVSSSATLIFNSLSLTSTGSLTPLIIDSI